MIRNYFWVIHITFEKIIIGNTQPADSDPGTSPEDSLKVLTYNLQGKLQGTLRRLSGDQYQNWWFYEKIASQK